MAELGQDWDRQTSAGSPKRRARPTLTLDAGDLEAMSAYTYREIADACGISKNTVTTLFRTRKVSRLILEKLSEFFPHFKARLSTGDGEEQSPRSVHDMQTVFTKEWWDLFRVIRSLYESGHSAEAHAIALVGLSAKETERWTVCGLSALYIASARDEPHYFLAAARKIAERMETQPKLDPVLAFLMATDLAKFQVEHGESARAEPYYDALINQYQKWERRLTPGQQVATLRGHGTLKTLRLKLREARRSLEIAAQIGDTSLDTRAATLYRLSQLAWIDSESPKSDHYWHALGNYINSARSSPPQLRSTQDGNAINPITLLGARLTYIGRPENQQRLGQVQDELDEFVTLADAGCEAPRRVIQNASAQATLANQSRNPATTQKLLRLIKPRLHSESIAAVEGLLKSLCALLDRQ